LGVIAGSTTKRFEKLMDELLFLQPEENEPEKVCHQLDGVLRF